MFEDAEAESESVFSGELDDTVVAGGVTVLFGLDEDVCMPDEREVERVVARLLAGAELD